MKAKTITGKEVKIIGKLSLTQKSSYREKTFIVAKTLSNVQAIPRLYFISEINGMTKKKVAILPPFCGDFRRLIIPAEIDSKYI